MEKSKLNWWVPLIKGLVFLVLGVFIINQPDESMKFFISSLGIVLILLGIAVASFSYYTRKRLSGYMSYLVFGIVQIVLGLIVYFNQELGVKIIAWSIALVVGYSGVMNFMASIVIRNMGVTLWKWVMLIAIVEGLIGLMFILDPEAFSLKAVTVLGVGMIIFGLLNMLIGVNLRRTITMAKEEPMADEGEE